MRMLMKQIIRTKKITFEVEPVLDLEFEPLDTSNWPDELIKKTDKITNELEELFDNYDKR
ncbi:MAG: hypothetical protein LBU14_00790 [Candidatus Peribacteria bacterium]|jgi:hypothetical protein|nr:hypothetical protein [Candidatus Peribacteria bacterium]